MFFILLFWDILKFTLIVTAILTPIFLFVVTYGSCIYIALHSIIPALPIDLDDNKNMISVFIIGLLILAILTFLANTSRLYRVFYSIFLGANLFTGTLLSKGTSLTDIGISIVLSCIAACIYYSVMNKNMYGNSNDTIAYIFLPVFLYIHVLSDLYMIKESGRGQRIDIFLNTMSYGQIAFFLLLFFLLMTGIIFAIVMLIRKAKSSNTVS